ncbi:hypothetical protein P691DRAFT_362075 [Macrolepiota fuliginosa MF-IS2]|uniref:NACHT domain-containing protein n=1 Tax=Macrolepiota fuliginosa MF-IS2 TaxID=1400762 RepID=A0A9P5X4Z6_9AGAR|nr:hypothetical protein P691DRAFT_362075 [Macrolepiota fuliginosa MF-IS2]
MDHLEDTDNPHHDHSLNDHARQHPSSSTSALTISHAPITQGPPPACEIPGKFHNSHHFVVNYPVFNDVTYNPETFMEKLEKRTIPGAEYDSSERDPPPRCHPGTRLQIVEQAQELFDDFRDGKRLLWIVGPAGVGKSAVVQTLAENASTPSSKVMLGASLFFSVNGRDDASKAIPTLVYQIAVKHHPYRQFIHNEIANDPKLPTKSIQTQFRKFFIEPFVDHDIYHEPKPLLVLIDGLDECVDKEKQCELISLISYFSVAYPDVPLVWVISCRPEPHITTTFSRPSIAPSFTKQEIIVDSDQARVDVERYLRDELGKIRAKYSALSFGIRWPMEHDFLKLSAASDGLFVFASIATRFIDDPNHGNPAVRLKQLLDLIDDIPTLPPRQSHTQPMAKLDVLYARILSQVPEDLLPETRKLLLLLLMLMTRRQFDYLGLPWVCNWLGVTPDVVYGALHHLHSVLDIPSPEVACDSSRHLRAFHKSFLDYLGDFTRSGMFAEFHREGTKLDIECMERIFIEVSEKHTHHPLNAAACISVFWSYGSSQCVDDQKCLIQEAQEKTYNRAMERFCLHFQRKEAVQFRYWKLFDMTSYLGHHEDERFEDVREMITDDERRYELLQHSVLSKIPIVTLDASRISGSFSSAVLCKYECLRAEYPQFRGELVGASHVAWYLFDDTGDYFPRKWLDSPNHLVTAYTDIRGLGWVLYEFPDLTDKRGRWSFTFPYLFLPAASV